jgi:hypothetical protein
MVSEPPRERQLVYGPAMAHSCRCQRSHLENALLVVFFFLFIGVLLLKRFCWHKSVGWNRANAYNKGCAFGTQKKGNALRQKQMGQV